MIACDVVAIGSADGADVEPRVLLQAALQCNARAVILAHNHPSGDGAPSRADVSLTARLDATLRMIDVHLLDHLVIGAGRSYSFNEAGLLPPAPRAATLTRLTRAQSPSRSR